MGKIAFLYPGQGSQRVGMGAEIRQAHPELFERHLGAADAASGLPISRYCLEGPQERLTETQVAQPALFAVSLALTDHARQAGLRPDFVAGHSLGEYTAAVASGALSMADGTRLVCLRGRLMADIQSKRPGTMAAVIGLPADRLRALCAAASGDGVVTLANVNTPVQLVVSGEAAAVERVVELARGAGADRVVRLQVGAAFHSPLMEPVQQQLATTMAEVRWQDPEVPLAANASGSLLREAGAIHRALIAQITGTVQWVACVQTLVAAGCTTFLEIGPGRVLSGLVHQIAPEAATAAADAPKKIDAFVQSRSGSAAPSV